MHGKKLKREKGDIAKATQTTSGIKSLSKEKREMLEVCLKGGVFVNEYLFESIFHYTYLYHLG